MSDLELKCSDCGKDFFFKEKDQEFYKKMEFSYPKRCWDCRQIKKNKKLDKAKAAAYKKE